MRLKEMFEDSLNYDEEKNGPRPDDVYPVEKIDYLYYVQNGMQNPIDQIFSAGYVKELFDTDMHLHGYYPVNKISKMVSIAYPIKIITTFINDKVKKKK